MALTGVEAGCGPASTPGGEDVLHFPAHGARLSLQVLMELRGRIVPLPPCLDEQCTCHGVFYKDVCTTSCRVVAILQLNWEDGPGAASPHAAEVRAAFKDTPPQVVVSHAGKGVTTVVGDTDFDVEATFAEATTSTPDQWVLFFRPNITTERRNALCHLRVGVGAPGPTGEPRNYVDLDMEIRSKPSAWLVVENIPDTWDMQALENFLRHFCEPTTIRCTTHAKFTAFVQLAKRSLATGIMDGWSRQAPTLLEALDAEDLVVSWTMNLNQPCAADQPFAPGSGWKAPSHCRIGRVYQEGGDGSVPDHGGVAPGRAMEQATAHPAGAAVVAPAGGAAYAVHPRKHGRDGPQVVTEVRSHKRQRRTAPVFEDPDMDFDIDALLAELGEDTVMGVTDDFVLGEEAATAGAGAGAGAGARIVVPAPMHFESGGKHGFVLPTFLAAPAPMTGSPVPATPPVKAAPAEVDARPVVLRFMPIMPVVPLVRTISPGAGSPAAWAAAATAAGLMV